MKPDLHIIPAEDRGKGVVARLQDALKKARAGEISSIAIAWVDREGIGDWRWSEAPNVNTLIGTVERLKHDIITSVDGG